MPSTFNVEETFCLYDSGNKEGSSESKCGDMPAGKGHTTQDVD